MTGKTRVLTPDIVLKKYWDDKEHFADLFNAALFNGRQVIRPQELEDDDSANSVILKNGKQVRGFRTARDNIKLCRNISSQQSVRLVLLGQESQSHIHYAMPLRVMGYDYGAYKRQYDSNAKRYRAERKNSGSAKSKENGTLPEVTIVDSIENSIEDRDEFLSNMKRTDKFIPVITVVVYYGEKPWDGATSLHEMLDIPDQMSAFVNDYRMFLVEARKNDLVFHNHDNADLFHLLSILLNTDIPKKEARQKAIQYSEEHNTDSSVIMTVAGATGSNIDLDKFEKGDMRMCTFVEEIRKEGIEEGIKKGIKEGRAEEIIETGYEFGLGESEILKRLQHKLNISMQAAQEYLCEYAR